MSFHRVKQEILRIKTKTAFIQSISAEKDLYACGIMVEAAQILFGKKWISSNAVENQDVEKIEKNDYFSIFYVNKGDKGRLIGKKGKNIKNLKKLYGNIVVKEKK